MRRAPHPDDARIDEALARGVTLRFTGKVFEEASRDRGTGPVYPALAVLCRARAGKALISTTSGEGMSFEIVVKAAPKRSLSP